MSGREDLDRARALAESAADPSETLQPAGGLFDEQPGERCPWDCEDLASHAPDCPRNPANRKGAPDA